MFHHSTPKSDIAFGLSSAKRLLQKASSDLLSYLIWFSLVVFGVERNYYLRPEHLPYFTEYK